MTLKRSQKPLKRSPLKKRSQKAILQLPERIQQEQEQRKVDNSIYLAIWDKREHRCQVSGEYLGREPLTTFFHHLLKKETYPEYRYDFWNILIVSPAVHEKCERMGNQWDPILQKFYLAALEKHRKFVENQDK